MKKNGIINYQWTIFLDMPIPQTKAIMLPLLQFAVDGKEHTVDEAEENLASHFNLTKNERAVIKKKWW